MVVYCLSWWTYRVREEEGIVVDISICGRHAMVLLEARRRLSRGGRLVGGGSVTVSERLWYNGKTRFWLVVAVASRSIWNRAVVVDDDQDSDDDAVTVNNLQLLVIIPGPSNGSHCNHCNHNNINNLFCRRDHHRKSRYSIVYYVYL